MKQEFTSNRSPATAQLFTGSWVVLFPATYLIHIAEEYWGGFPAWTAGRTGLAISDIAFLAANAFLWVLMVGAVVIILSRPSRALLIVSLATIAFINALLHIGASLLTLSYSPGLASGVLLWLPLGIAALARGHRVLPMQEFRWGVVAGVVAHILVPLVGLGFAVAFGGGFTGA